MNSYEYFCFRNTSPRNERVTLDNYGCTPSGCKSMDAMMIGAQITWGRPPHEGHNLTECTLQSKTVLFDGQGCTYITANPLCKVV